MNLGFSVKNLKILLLEQNRISSIKHAPFKISYFDWSWYRPIEFKKKKNWNRAKNKTRVLTWFQNFDMISKFQATRKKKNL